MTACCTTQSVESFEITKGSREESGQLSSLRKREGRKY